MTNFDTTTNGTDEYGQIAEGPVMTPQYTEYSNIEEFNEITADGSASILSSITNHAEELQNNLEEQPFDSEEADWNDAVAANTKEAYQKYMDTYPEGSHRSEARERIESMLQSSVDLYSDDMWSAIDKNDITALQNFVELCGNSVHRQEAMHLLKELKKETFIGVGIKACIQRIHDIHTDKSIMNPAKATFELIETFIRRGNITVDEFLAAIEEDNNLISGEVANMLWDTGIITNFERTGISHDFITQMISNVKPQAFSHPKPMERITKTNSTEVYFWGLPSSGKSCALGAILSCASSGNVAKTMQLDPDCQGYGYMIKLANLFKMNGGVGRLPEGTPTTATYEMGFTLEDEKGYEHPITCIDLAGELVECMFLKDAGDVLNEGQENTLKALTNALVDHRTQNRKIHFFVLEYGAENKEYKGLPQQALLQAAAAYIQKTGIFKKDTDGIYLLISKVDKAKAVGPELIGMLRSHIATHYQGFYNILQKICRSNEINDGKVEILPFTLGEVCFQDYCKFNGESASNVVRTLIRRSHGYKTGKLARFFNWFKN